MVLTWLAILAPWLTVATQWFSNREGARLLVVQRETIAMQEKRIAKLEDMLAEEALACGRCGGGMGTHSAECWIILSAEGRTGIELVREPRS